MTSLGSRPPPLAEGRTQLQRFLAAKHNSSRVPTVRAAPPPDDNQYQDSPEDLLLQAEPNHLSLPLQHHGHQLNQGNSFQVQTQPAQQSSSYNSMSKGYNIYPTNLLEVQVPVEPTMQDVGPE